MAQACGYERTALAVTEPVVLEGTTVSVGGSGTIGGQ